MHTVFIVGITFLARQRLYFMKTPPELLQAAALILIHIVNIRW